MNSEAIKRIITHSEVEYKNLKSTVVEQKKPKESKFKQVFEVLKKKLVKAPTNNKTLPPKFPRPISSYNRKEKLIEFTASKDAKE